MRTTVEMKPEHRSALLALSARGAEKGEVLRLAASLTSEDAEALRATTKLLRESWR